MGSCIYWRANASTATTRYTCGRSTSTRKRSVLRSPDGLSSICFAPARRPTATTTATSEPTQTEWQLWQALRCRQLGVSFRRQVVLQGYITDFYASAVRLIVEVDGGWHDHRVPKDARRERILLAAGYRVLRITAEEVAQSLPGAVARIRAAVVEL